MKTVPKLIIGVIILTLTGCASWSMFQHKLLIYTSEDDSEIFVNNDKIGNGKAYYSLRRNECIHVVVTKTGYFKEEREYCKSRLKTKPPRTALIKLIPDEAFQSSIQVDNSNTDISINVNEELTEDEAWKLLAQIVTSRFDVLEVADKNTGYLRTSWVVQTFPKTTIRTRVIIKSGGTDPLVFKLKVNSEIADEKASVKADEKFRPWDRLLKKYDGLIEEAVSRLF